ncbi:DNA-binding protein [Streptococcus penaeicida]|uniref:DNA-binding protein n=1 Tax=Streptococcus penaeicida TaxID=1765960 RepID=A0A2N8LCS7_9STRE|nr:SatD family protein [Streptococcus penaeicida]PND47968.1 DNA-binding protein [Streptococcus penaeicida]
MVYLALIGDLIQSKQLANRNQAQEQFHQVLEKINQQYENCLVSNLSLTLGDEFQGLFTLEAPIFQIIDQINHEMADFSIRFGLGLGDILTAINPQISIGADGPAYWKAREAINYIHQKNDYGHTQIAIRTGQEPEEDILNSLLSAGEAIKSSWRASQLDVFHALIEANYFDEQFDQGEIAKRLNLSPSALSKRLKSSNIKVYLRTRQSALQLIQEKTGKETA